MRGLTPTEIIMLVIIFLLVFFCANVYRKFKAMEADLEQRTQERDNANDMLYAVCLGKDRQYRRQVTENIRKAAEQLTGSKD